MNDAAGVPVARGGVTVTFDGIPAPLLYASANQINVQAPFAVKQSTAMQITFNGSQVASQEFAVVPENPSLIAVAGHDPTAVAFNADGTLNSSSNPAQAGAELTLLVNGTGLDATNQVTGSLSGSNPPLIAAPVAVSGNFIFSGDNYSLEVDSFTDAPGTISGLGQIKIRVPPPPPSLNPSLYLPLTLVINGAESMVHPGVYVKP